MARIGILGGTFDPIHMGHLVPAQYAVDYLKLDNLILVPSASPVHRPHHIPAANEHRLRMCQLAARWIPPFSVSDLEVTRKEPSYTVLTLGHFRQTLPPGTELVLLVGEDNLPLLHAWYRVTEIFDLAGIAILPRPVQGRLDLKRLESAIGPDRFGDLLDHRVPSPLVEISATEIRSLVRSDQSVAGLVPASVAEYIDEHHLYRVTSGGP